MSSIQSHCLRQPSRNFAGKLFIIALLTLTPVGSAFAQAHPPTRFTVSGEPQQIGEAIGKQYKSVIQNFRTQFIKLAESSTGKSKAMLAATANRLAKHMDADDIAEIRGLARGAGTSYEDMLTFNLFYALVVNRIACRQLAVWGPATSDGKLVHGRNLDWFDYPGNPMIKHNLILNIKPTTGIEYVLLTWPAQQGVLTGSNRAGITVAFNQLRRGKDQRRAAEPIFFSLKRVLRKCYTVEQAVTLIKRANPVGNGSIMISDARQRKAIVMELFDGSIGTRDGNGGMIGNANHATRAAGLRNVPYVGSADAPTDRLARSLGVKLNADLVQGVMAHPSVCQLINMQSVVVVPQDNVMYFACGAKPAAQKAPFRRYKLFEDFKRLAVRPNQARKKQPALSE